MKKVKYDIARPDPSISYNSIIRFCMGNPHGCPILIDTNELPQIVETCHGMSLRPAVWFLLYREARPAVLRRGRPACLPCVG